MIILDSTACIDFLQGIENIKNLLDNSNDIIRITVISVDEIFIGVKSTKRKRSYASYNTLIRNWKRFISNMQIVSLGLEEAMKSLGICDQLSPKGNIIEDNDILFAGIMLSKGIKKIIT